MLQNIPLNLFLKVNVKKLKKYNNYKANSNAI